MKKEEVPQQSGALGGLREVCYAVDEEGRYVLEPSAGWEPSNYANVQAWELLREELDQTMAAVERGKASPLAVYMVVSQMDAGLLASYAGVPKRKVKKHMTPAGFAKLDQATATRYSQVLGVDAAQLSRVPDSIRLPGEEVNT